MRYVSNGLKPARRRDCASVVHTASHDGRLIPRSVSAAMKQSIGKGTGVAAHIPLLGEIIRVY